MMAGAFGLIGGTPGYGVSAPGSPWVQELDGPLGIKALFTHDPYALMVISNHLTRRSVLAALAGALLAATLLVTGCGSSGAGNPDSRISGVPRDQANCA